jgi:signal transduction histidine kinase
MWKKLLTISLIFAISVVILIALSLYAFERFDGYVRYTNAVEHHHQLLSELRKLSVHLAEVETRQRAFLLFNDSSYYSEYYELIPRIKESFAAISKVVHSNPDQRKRVEKLNFLIKDRLDILRSGIEVGYPPTDYKQERSHFDKCQAIMVEMEQAENALLANQLEAQSIYEKSTPQKLRIVFVTTMLIFAVSFGLLIQQYRNRVYSQQQLEKSMAELNQANAEWEQMTYVASHDLQEPLRKIRTFTDILQTRYLSLLDDEGKVLVKRIATASARAQFLMVDIVNYNSIVFPLEELYPVDLKEIVSELVQDQDASLKARKTDLFIDELPVVRGYPAQMQLLFRSLIENSIKFAKPDEALKITLTTNTVPRKELPVQTHLSFTHYHMLTFDDNGIGFENEFADKIFKIFQRLHSQDSKYDGRGIGLAMVKRIMTNHLGFVVARGRPGKGARFILYFPVR